MAAPAAALWVVSQWGGAWVCSRSGHGVTEDPGEAVRMLRGAAEQGYADAQFNLARLCEAGRGTAKDLPTATRLYNFAAEQGHPRAKEVLARIKRS
jgi:TPR repeat protein